MPTSVWRLLKPTFKAWWRDNTFRMASSLAFYTIFSLAPILMIAVALAGILLKPEEAGEQIVRQIEMLTGSEGAAVARQVLSGASGLGRKPLAILGGVAAMIVSSTAVFASLQEALNEIWGVKATPGTSLWKWLWDRFRSFGIVLAVGFLLIVSTVLSALIAGVQAVLTETVADMAFLWGVLDSVTSFVIVSLLFAAIYRYLPDVQIRWRDVAVGAAITAILFTAGKWLIGLYLGHVAIGSTYGAAGSFVVLLIWIYYSALISFFGAEFTKVYAEHRGSPTRPQAHAVETGRKRL